MKRLIRFNIGLQNSFMPVQGQCRRQSQRFFASFDSFGKKTYAMGPPIQSSVLEDWIDRGRFKKLFGKQFEKLVFERDSEAIH